MTEIVAWLMSTKERMSLGRGTDSLVGRRKWSISVKHLSSA